MTITTSSDDKAAAGFYEYRGDDGAAIQVQASAAGVTVLQHSGGALGRGAAVLTADQADELAAAITAAGKAARDQANPADAAQAAAPYDGPERRLSGDVHYGGLERRVSATATAKAKPSDPTKLAPGEEWDATPAATAQAKALGVDIGQMPEGTGAGGTVTKSDVTAHDAATKDEGA